MSLFDRAPCDPYNNLLVAAVLGVPAGSLIVSIYLAIFQSVSLAQALSHLGGAFSYSLAGYFAMAVLLPLYGLPALWLALELRRAGPASALLVASLPGLWFGYRGAWSEAFAWLPLAISVASGLTFVALAYPKVPSCADSTPKAVTDEA